MSDEPRESSETQAPKPDPPDESANAPASDVDGAGEDAHAAETSAAAAPSGESTETAAAEVQAEAEGMETPEGEAQAGRSAADAVETAAEPAADETAPTAEAVAADAAGLSAGGDETADAFDAAAEAVADGGDEVLAEGQDTAIEPAEVWTDPLGDAEDERQLDADSGPSAEEAPAPVLVGEETTDGAGTPVDVLPLDVAEAIAQSKQRRRRLGLYVAVPTIVIGLLIALTQLRSGRGGGTPAEVRDWESGMSLVQTGDVAEGIEMLEGVVTKLPRGAERAVAHVRLAEVYRTLGEHDSYYLNSAIRHYTSALDWAESAETPGAAIPVDELLYRTGECFAALGSYETALEFYEQIDSEFPTSTYRPQAKFEAGEALLAIGQYERGRQVLAEVAAAYRGDPLGEQAFFRFADSFDEQARSLKAE